MLRGKGEQFVNKFIEKLEKNNNQQVIFPEEMKKRMVDTYNALFDYICDKSITATPKQENLVTYSKLIQDGDIDIIYTGSGKTKIDKVNITLG